MLVHHHVKYKEIHGVDEVVLMEKGEHTRLHNRLRREGKCNILSEDLHKLSVSAYMRREDVRKRLREYTLNYLKKRRIEPVAREKYLIYQREYWAKTRTIYPRLRPDIISSAMTPD